MTNWSKWFNTVTDNLKSHGDWMTAFTRHRILSEKFKWVKQHFAIRKDQQTLRENIAKEAGPALRINETVTQLGTTAKKLGSLKLVQDLKTGQYKEFFNYLSKNKWAKKGIWAVGGLLALRMISGAIHFSPSPAIPNGYQRGYDIMDENMTDFGSPVKLIKTASKIITPYYSSIRKGIKTSVNTVMEDNFALFSSKHAIGHTRY